MPSNTFNRPRFFAASSRCMELSSASGLGRSPSLTGSSYRKRREVQHQKPQSLSGDPPGKGTGPARQIDSRGNNVGRVPSRGISEKFPNRLSDDEEPRKTT